MIYTHPRVTGTLQGLGDVAAMAAESAAALARRQADYPARVAAEKLTQAEADTDIFIWAQIAADWAFIASNNGETGAPASGGTLRARIAALDTGIERFFAAIDRAAEKQRRPAAQTMSAQQQQQITALLAMRYWAAHEAKAHVLAGPLPGQALSLHPRQIAWINHELRNHSSCAERKAA